MTVYRSTVMLVLCLALPATLRTSTVGLARVGLNLHRAWFINNLYIKMIWRVFLEHAARANEERAHSVGARGYWPVPVHTWKCTFW